SGANATCTLLNQHQMPCKAAAIKRRIAQQNNGGAAMKYALPIAALVLAAGQVAPAFAQNSAGDLVRQAVGAEGGADALRGLKSLAVKGDAKFWEPGQSFAAGGEPRFLGDATFAITWDLAKGMARTDWVRDQKYPDPPIKLKYTE